MCSSVMVLRSTSNVARVQVFRGDQHRRGPMWRLHAILSLVLQVPTSIKWHYCFGTFPKTPNSQQKQKLTKFHDWHMMRYKIITFRFQNTDLLISRPVNLLIAVTCRCGVFPILQQWGVGAWRCTEWMCMLKGFILDTRQLLAVSWRFPFSFSIIPHLFAALEDEENTGAPGECAGLPAKAPRAAVSWSLEAVKKQPPTHCERGRPQDWGKFRPPS